MWIMVVLMFWMFGPGHAPPHAYQLKTPPEPFVASSFKQGLKKMPRRYTSSEAQLAAYRAFMKEHNDQHEATLLVTQWLPYYFWRDGPVHSTLVECEAIRFSGHRLWKQNREDAETTGVVRKESIADAAARVPFDNYNISLTAAAYARCVAVR
jgi:hypothetical protein